MEAAIGLFAARGYDATSTKEICETAETNIASLHYHYKTKENLYRTIIQRFGELSLESAVRALQAPKTAAEVGVRLEIYLSEVLETCLANPDIFKIVQREIESPSIDGEDLFRGTLLKSHEALSKFLHQAGEKGFISKEIEAPMAAGALWAQIGSIIRNDSINKKYFKASIHETKYRAKWLQQTLHLFLKGCQTGS